MGLRKGLFSLTKKKQKRSRNFQTSKHKNILFLYFLSEARTIHKIVFFLEAINFLLFIPLPFLNPPPSLFRCKCIWQKKSESLDDVINVYIGVNKFQQIMNPSVSFPYLSLVHVYIFSLPFVYFLASFQCPWAVCLQNLYF